MNDDGVNSRPRDDRIRLPLWTKILLGMCAGLLLPMFVILRVFMVDATMGSLLLFLGPVFGGFMVYFLEKQNDIRTRFGQVGSFAAAGALAGGAAVGLGHDLGLFSIWHVGIGFLAGGAIGLWILLYFFRRL